MKKSAEFERSSDFNIKNATLPSGASDTLRQNGYKQNSANVEIRRFCFDLHGCPVPLQQ